MFRFLIPFVIIFIVGVADAGAAEKDFGGVGLQVVPTINGDLVILNVLKGAPAAEKGLEPGDLVFQVDDFVLHGSEFGKVVSEHLWGVVGSTVTLHFRRPGVAGDRQVEIVRTSMDPHLTVTPTVRDSGKDPGEMRN